MMPAIDFWFSIGSTYSYLSVARLARVAAASDVEFRWRPFNVRSIMIEMDNVPFAKKPVKAAYMWRDIERRAQMYGLSPQFPVPYPLAELERANRVAVIGAQEGWCASYATSSYQLWFEAGLPAGSEPNISQSIREAGADPEAILTRADAAEGIEALLAATAEAKALGIFGSPSFVVDGELFWGDDRLDDALNWHGQLKD
jgi:2-hydroxychromene-2-carboxylate isomerase